MLKKSIVRYLNSQINGAELTRFSSINSIYTIEYNFLDSCGGGWITVLKKDLLKFERAEKLKDVL